MTPEERPAALDARRRALLDAVTARLVPSDEHGPGAREANVVRYVERTLAGPRRDVAPAYAEGLDALDRHAEALHGAPFATLAPAAQDELLRDLERGAVAGLRDGGAFFSLVLGHTLEGMFGDPAWGGNEGGAGWELLGYPGARHVWEAEDQALDAVPLAVREPVAVVPPPAHTVPDTEARS